MAKQPPTGLEVRHSRSCPANEDPELRCKCDPSVRAWIYDRRQKKRVRKTFTGSGAMAAAKNWRADAFGQVRRGELQAPTRHTVRETSDVLLEAMGSGEVRGKGGRPYKPSTIESYRTSLCLHVWPGLGPHRIADVTRADVQALVDRAVRSGQSGQTVRNSVTALAAVARFAQRRGWISTNPCRDLELPAAGGRRDRVVDPSEAKVLLDLLPLELRCIYGIGTLAGLRRGEIAGLDWADIDPLAGTITVWRSYCWRGRGFGLPKSDAGVRTVPMIGVLTAMLLDWKEETGGEGLVFPSARDRSVPFQPRGVSRRADTAWRNEARRKAEAAGKDPKSVTSWPRLILHEGRHSAASVYIASGLDPVRVSKWMGHSQVSTTTDIYAKAFQAREKHDAALVESFINESLASAQS